MIRTAASTSALTVPFLPTGRAALIANREQAYTSIDGPTNGVAVRPKLEARVNINPVSNVGPVSRTNTGNAAKPTAAESPKSLASRDVIEFSPAAKEILAADEPAKTESSLRAERLAQIKAQIEAGTYDTDSKFDAAVERMLDELL